MTELSLAERFPHGLGGVRIHAVGAGGHGISAALRLARERGALVSGCDAADSPMARALASQGVPIAIGHDAGHADRSEEHTSELQSHSDLVCRLLLEKKKTNTDRLPPTGT